MAELFLVRTKQNQIWGPIAKELLVERVSRGELDSQDEICRSGEYWIFMHETEEVVRVLGVIPPAKKKQKTSEDEDTETDTQTDTVPVESGTPTAPVVNQQANVVPAQQGSTAEKAGQVPYYEETHYRLEQPGLFKLIVAVLLMAIAYVVYQVYTMTQP